MEVAVFTVQDTSGNEFKIEVVKYAHGINIRPEGFQTLAIDAQNNSLRLVLDEVDTDDTASVTDLERVNPTSVSAT